MRIYKLLLMAYIIFSSIFTYASRTIQIPAFKGRILNYLPSKVSSRYDFIKIKYFSYLGHKNYKDFDSFEQVITVSKTGVFILPQRQFKIREEGRLSIYVQVLVHLKDWPEESLVKAGDYEVSFYTDDPLDMKNSFNNFQEKSKILSLYEVPEMELDVRLPFNTVGAPMFITGYLELENQASFGSTYSIDYASWNPSMSKASGNMLLTFGDNGSNPKLTIKTYLYILDKGALMDRKQIDSSEEEKNLQDLLKDGIITLKYN